MTTHDTESASCSSGPFVVHGACDAWPARQWSPDEWTAAMGTEPVRTRFRSRRHSVDTIDWEHDSLYAQCTMSQLMQWINKPTTHIVASMQSSDQRATNVQSVNSNDYW
jgi:hypothetical protein